MSNKFSFLDSLNDVSKPKEESNDVMIDIDLIEPFALNDEIYPPESYKENEEELVESIRENGVLQNIEVVENKNKPGYYISVGGNRRCAAVRYIVNVEGNKDFKYRKIKATVLDLTEEEMVMHCIMSNSYRTKTDYSILQEIAFLQKNIESMKAKGEKIPGGVKAYIARATKLGKTQAGKLQTVVKKGTEELKEAVKDEKISLEGAYYASLEDEEKQKEYVEKVSNEEMTSKDIVEEVKEKRRVQKEQEPIKSDDNDDQIDIQNTEPSEVKADPIRQLKHDIEDKLNAEVKLSAKKLEIKFADENDMERILKLLNLK